MLYLNDTDQANKWQAERLKTFKSNGLFHSLPVFDSVSATMIKNGSFIEIYS